MFWKERDGMLHRHHHFRLRLANAYSTNGVSIELHPHEGLGAFLAQRGVVATLNNSENLLAIGSRLFTAFLRPANRPIDGRVNLLWRARVRRTIVEDHGNVRSEQALNLHGFPGSEEEQRSIEVGTELNSMCLDFPDAGQTEDLESAAVGQNRTGPTDKSMEAAGSADDVQTWPDMKVISVAQNNLRAHLA